MKKQTNRKAIVFSMVMAAMLSLPTMTQAQTRQGGLFGSKSSDVQHTSMLNRDNMTMTGGIGNESYGAPVGGGLLVLTAIGAGYLALKKKKEN